MTRRHPDAFREKLQAKAVERSELEMSGNARGWKWDLGWLIVLVAESMVLSPDGATMQREKHYRHADSYGEAVEIRREEMSSGRYYCAWIIEKTGRTKLQ